MKDYRLLYNMSDIFKGYAFTGLCYMLLNSWNYSKTYIGRLNKHWHRDYRIVFSKEVSKQTSAI